MIRNEENQEETSVLPFLMNPLAEIRGQVQFCQSFIATVFGKGDSQCTREFPEVKIKRQLLDHYLKGMGNIRQQNGLYTRNQFTI